jgi:uncharacterized protein HemX
MGTSDIIAGVVVIAGIGFGGYGWYKYNQLETNNTRQAATILELQDTNDKQKLSLEAFQKQEKSNEELQASRQDAEVVHARTVAAVGELRKSIANLKSSSSDSLEACNKSYAVAGELLGTCGERYTGMAKNAELLRADAIALDQHTDILRGLVTDLQGLEPLNGSK